MLQTSRSLYAHQAPPQYLTRDHFPYRLSSVALKR
ncbi:Uncharacterised protein [Vibrio cholerae]|nr:Uncharacterised protein [Vibrio cholerae]